MEFIEGSAGHISTLKNVGKQQWTKTCVYHDPPVPLTIHSPLLFWSQNRSLNCFLQNKFAVFIFSFPVPFPDFPIAI